MDAGFNTASSMTCLGPVQSIKMSHWSSFVRCRLGWTVTACVGPAWITWFLAAYWDYGCVRL